MIKGLEITSNGNICISYIGFGTNLRAINTEEQSLSNRYTPITQQDHETHEITFLGSQFCTWIRAWWLGKEVTATELLIVFWGIRSCPSALSHCRKEQIRPCWSLRTSLGSREGASAVAQQVKGVGCLVPQAPNMPERTRKEGSLFLFCSAGEICLARH